LHTFDLTAIGQKTILRPMSQQHGESNAPGFSDEPLNEGVSKEIRDCAAEARRELKLDGQNVPPEAIQKAIYEKLQQLAVGEPLTNQDAESWTICLGSLWGQAICDAIGWEWCAVKHGEMKVFSIVKPDRSHFIQPLHFMKRQLAQRGPEAEITSLLLFNMLKDGLLPPSQPGQYYPLG
jgi:hypothetical protein